MQNILWQIFGQCKSQFLAVQRPFCIYLGDHQAQLSKQGLLRPDMQIICIPSPAGNSCLACNLSGKIPQAMYLHVGKFQNDNWCWCFGIFQGWEFALWFFVQITCFLRAKQKCNFLFSKCEYCSSCSSFCKGGFSLVTLFKRVTEVNAIFYKEWEEQWWAIHSFVLGIKREKAWRKEWIWNESLLNSKSFFHKEGIASVTLYFMYDNIISCGSLQKEQLEQIALVALFVKRDGANRVQKERKSQSVKEQIPNPGIFLFSYQHDFWIGIYFLQFSLAKQLACLVM